jgi:branched-chain amino acid transport system substrate-binding protein
LIRAVPNITKLKQFTLEKTLSNLNLKVTLSASLSRERKTTGRYTMKKIQAGVIAALALVLSLTLAACGGGSDTIKIAYQGPLSGGEAQTGIDEQNAVKFAIELYNATNPEKKIELVSADDQGDGTVAAGVAPGIANDESIVAVVGPAYSGATIASLPYYKEAGMPLISPSATKVSLTDPAAAGEFGGPVFHRIPATDKIQGPALGKLAISGVAAPKVFVVDDQTAYSVGLVEYLVPSLPKGALVGTDSTKNDTADFAPTVAKIKSKGANVVIYTGYYSQAAVLVKQLRDGGYKGIFAGGDGVLNSEFAVLGGAAAEGARLTGATVPLGELSADLAAKFKESQGVEPGVYAAESFDAANIIIEAIKAGNTTRETIMAFIKSVSYVGVGGQAISFDANGDSTLGFINGFEVKAGKVVSTGAVK